MTYVVDTASLKLENHKPSSLISYRYRGLFPTG